MTTLSLLEEDHPLADNIPSRIAPSCRWRGSRELYCYLTMCGTRIATHSYRTHRTACTRTLATKAKLGVVGESRDGYSAHRSIFQNALEDTCSPLVLLAHARVLSPVAVVHHQYLC